MSISFCFNPSSSWPHPHDNTKGCSLTQLSYLFIVAFTSSSSSKFSDGWALNIIKFYDALNAPSFRFDETFNSYSPFLAFITYSGINSTTRNPIFNTKVVESHLMLFPSLVIRGALSCAYWYLPPHPPTYYFFSLTHPP